MSDPVDHVAVALARLPHYMRGGDTDSNTQKVLRILLSPGADFETAAQQVLTGMDVNTAVGAQLDVVGAKVGCAREGETDDEIYRRRIRATITANRSDGLIADILTIARLVVFEVDATYKIRNVGAAAYYLEIGNIQVADERVMSVLMEMLLQATAGGVRPILAYSIAPVGDEARWTTQGTWGTALWAAVRDREF